MPGEVPTENFKALFPTEFELLAKNQQGGPFGPPLIGSRVNIPPNGGCNEGTVFFYLSIRCHDKNFKLSTNMSASGDIVWRELE